MRRAVPHSLYRRYRRRKIAWQIAHYEPREASHLYGGHPLRVRLEDPLAEGWYDHDWDQPQLISFLREHGVLRPGAVVFDIGAHQAVVALMLAREVGAEGRVVAVEAEPHNARVAAANAELNDAGNLLVVHAAGGAAPGSIPFAEGLNGHVEEGTAGNVMVPIATVDELAREHGRPDLVLVDVEGYEGHVLEGATATLANGSSSFVVEVHETLADFGGRPQELVDRFGAFDRYLAAGEEEPFERLEGPAPAGRFFFAALAGDREDGGAGRPT
jgi:FkbM family methyltransferase